MPGFNQKGPHGEGEMTGGQRGMCQRTEDQFFPKMRDDSEGGRGMGNGQGFRRRQGFKHGRGFGRGASDIQNPVRRYEMEDGDNVEALKKQYQAAQEMVTAIENKIKDLESGK